MASFPTTPEELDDYISDYMDAHIASRITEITDEAIAAAVEDYMRSYGAAMEDNGAGGEVPLVADDYFTQNDGQHLNDSSMPMASMSNGVPVAYFQARMRAIALAAASLITSQDVKIPVVVQTQSSAVISANVLNSWNVTTGMEGVSVTFAAGDSGKVNEYLLRINVQEDNFSLELPSDVVWTDEAPAMENGYTYEISIINNRALYAAWENQ